MLAVLTVGVRVLGFTYKFSICWRRLMCGAMLRRSGLDLTFLISPQLQRLVYGVVLKLR